MNNNWESLAVNILYVIASAQVGILLAVSIIIVFHYSQHRQMRHIALVSISYVILTALVAGAMIFRIFYDGPYRMYAVAMGLVAFLLGDYALWAVWQNRNSTTSQELKSLRSRIGTNSQRLDHVEALLNIDGNEYKIEAKNAVLTKDELAE